MIVKSAGDNRGAMAGALSRNAAITNRGRAIKVVNKGVKAGDFESSKVA